MKRLRKKSFSKNQKKKLIPILITVLVISSASAFFITQKMNYTKLITAEAEKSNSLLKNVLMPIEDIEQGTILREEMFVPKQISFSEDDSMFMSVSDYGSRAKTTLLANQPVLDSQIYTEVIDDSLRTEEFNMFLLQSDLEENQTIDVRITYPNGENYLILAKKKIEKLNIADNIIWLNLNEKELQLIHSAINDSYITGTKLYVNRYVDSEIQDELTPNYIPRLEVLNAMSENPNLVQNEEERLYLETMVARRKMLDSRLNINSDTDSEKGLVEAGVQVEKGKNNEVIANRIQAEEESQATNEEVKSEETTEQFN